MRNQIIFLGCVALVAVLAVAPEVAFAAQPDINDSDARAWVQLFRKGFWLVSNAALFAGGAIALVAYLFGLGSGVLRFGVITALVGAFAEKIGLWLFALGGNDHYLDTATGMLNVVYGNGMLG